MTAVSIQIAYKDSAWFAANPTVVLKYGQHVYLSDGAGHFANAYKIGNGSADIQSLSWRGVGYIPLSGTHPSYPLTGIIEFQNYYGTAIGSLNGFYLGSGDDIDIQNANAYNAVLFETPVAGQSNQIYLNNQQGTWTTRKGSANAKIIKFADTAGTYIRIRTYDGTDFGEVVFTPLGVTGSAVFTPTQDEDFIQKGYADTVYMPKTKVAGSDVVAGGQITLPNTPSFTYLVHGNGIIYEEGDDYTRAGAVLTFTNPSVSDGDKIYFKYEY